MSGNHQGKRGDEEPQQGENVTPKSFLGSSATQEVKLEQESGFEPSQHPNPSQFEQLAAMDTSFLDNLMLLDPALRPTGDSVFSPGSYTDGYSIQGNNPFHTPHNAANSGYIFPTTINNGQYMAASYPASLPATYPNIGGHNPSVYNPVDNTMYTNHGIITGSTGVPTTNTRPRNPFYTTYTGPDLAARIGLDTIVAIANKATNHSLANDDSTTTSNPGNVGPDSENEEKYVPGGSPSPDSMLGHDQPRYI